jgi:hypothetical protein
VNHPVVERIRVLRHSLRQTAVNFEVSDLARCPNYSGMEALEWQGENPVIIPENTPVQRISSDGFMVIPKN